MIWCDCNLPPDFTPLSKQEQAKQDGRLAAEKALAACAERDAALLQLEDLQGLENQPPANGQTDSKVTVMKSHLQKIAALEAEVKRLKKVRDHGQAAVLL